MRTLGTDVVIEQAVRAYFSLALEQSAEISTRSTSIDVNVVFVFTGTTQPNRTKPCWHDSLRWANSARFGSVRPAFTRGSETKPNRTVPCWHSYKCSCEWGIRVSFVVLLNVSSPNLKECCFLQLKCLPLLTAHTQLA